MLIFAIQVQVYATKNLSLINVSLQNLKNSSRTEISFVCFLLIKITALSSNTDDEITLNTFSKLRLILHSVDTATLTYRVLVQNAVSLNLFSSLTLDF